MGCPRNRGKLTLPIIGPVKLWASTDVSVTPGTIFDFNDEDAIGGTFAHVGLVPPESHASYLLRFCNPGTATFTMTYTTVPAVSLTIMDGLISLVPLLGSATTYAPLALRLAEIPLYRSAVQHVINAITATDFVTQTIETLRAASDLTRLLGNRTQRDVLIAVLKDFGITFSLRELIGRPFRIARIIADSLRVLIDQGLSGGQPIVVSLTATS